MVNLTILKLKAFSKPTGIILSIVKKCMIPNQIDIYLFIIEKKINPDKPTKYSRIGEFKGNLKQTYILFNV